MYALCPADGMIHASAGYFCMETINSRKNPHIRHFRELGRSTSYRRETGLFLCEGEKLLSEALEKGAQVRELLLREGGAAPKVPGITAYLAGEDAFSFASPQENSPGPLFTVERRSIPCPERPERVIVLENVQDPGNVGTVLRTAAALGADAVLLVGACADPWQPKSVRGSMGALFRECVVETDLPGMEKLLSDWDLPLYGAALCPDSVDVRTVSLSRGAVAVGNEGRGLTQELLSLCREKIIIPMTPGSESLNAAVAASVLLWEMARQNG